MLANKRTSLGRREDLRAVRGGAGRGGAVQLAGPSRSGNLSCDRGEVLCKTVWINHLDLHAAPDHLCPRPYDWRPALHGKSDAKISDARASTGDEAVREVRRSSPRRAMRDVGHVSASDAAHFLFLRCGERRRVSTFWSLGFLSGLSALYYAWTPPKKRVLSVRSHGALAFRAGSGRCFMGCPVDCESMMRG